MSMYTVTTFIFNNDVLFGGTRKITKTYKNKTWAKKYFDKEEERLSRSGRYRRNGYLVTLTTSQNNPELVVIHKSKRKEKY